MTIWQDPWTYVLAVPVAVGVGVCVCGSPSSEPGNSHDL